MQYTIINKYTLYAVEAPSLDAAMEVAERHHTHAAKRGWTWSWEEVQPGHWFLDIRNSKNKPMRLRGYGCSLVEGRRIR